MSDCSMQWFDEGLYITAYYGWGQSLFEAAFKCLTPLIQRYFGLELEIIKWNCNHNIIEQFDMQF